MHFFGAPQQHAGQFGGGIDVCGWLADFSA
jgi:hypothetical protein